MRIVRRWLSGGALTFHRTAMTIPDRITKTANIQRMESMISDDWTGNPTPKNLIDTRNIKQQQSIVCSVCCPQTWEGIK